MNNKVDHDDPFEDPERLYAVCSTLICSSIFFPSQHFTKCLEIIFFKLSEEFAIKLCINIHTYMNFIYTQISEKLERLISSKT